MCHVTHDRQLPEIFQMVLYAQLLAVVAQLLLVVYESVMEISRCGFAIQLHWLESHREI
jgi:hypothetical protein